MSRRSEKEQFWRLVLEEYSQSGLPARDFCRRESISEPSFYGWRRKIRERDAEGQVGRELVPVNVIEPGKSTRLSPVESRLVSSLEIVTASGLTVRVDESCPVDLIRRALVAMRLADREGVSC